MKKFFLLVFFSLFFFFGSALAANFDLNNSSYYPAPAAPGAEISVWVNLQNTSNFSAKNVKVSVMQNYPFTTVPGKDSSTVSSVNPYQIVGFNFSVLIDSAAPNGDYKLGLKVTDDSIGEKTVNVNIRVVGKNPRVELVGSSAFEATPGKALSLDLKLKNIGGSVAKNVVVKIREDRTVTATGVVVDRDIIPLGASAALTENLKPEETAVVKMVLGINKSATLKNYSLPVYVDYYDDNGTAFSSTGYLGLNVIAQTELDAVISSVTPVATASGSSEINLDIFNIGAASASYIVAEVSMENADFSEPKVFIGTLDPDDFDSFKATAKFKPDAKTGFSDLHLKLTFKNANNEVKTIEKTLQVKILSPAEAQAASGNSGSGIIGLIGIVLEIVGLVVVARWLFNQVKKRLGK